MADQVSGWFDTSSLWMKLALWMIDISIVLDLFAHAIGSFGSGGIVSSCLVLGFICMLVACILVQGLVYLPEIRGNKIALICCIIFALIGGFLFAVGLAMDAGFSRGKFNRYAVNVLGWAALTGILGGIFCILEICNVRR